MRTIGIRSLRFSIWYCKAFLNRHVKLLSFCFIISFIFTLGILYLEHKQQIVFEDKLTIGMAGIYSMDNLPKNIQIQLSIGLTKIENNGQATPSAAESIVVDEFGTTYTIKLKRGLIWHDNKEFTANDINYNFKDVQKNVIDNNTVEFKLKEPFSPFPTLLAQPLFKKGFIGLGNYKLGRVDFDSNQIKSLELIPTGKIGSLKNTDLPEAVKRRIHSKTILEYKFYPVTQMVKMALKLGEIIVATGIKDSIDFSNNWYNIESVPDYSRYVAIFFNTKDNILRDKIVRQALSHSIPNNIKGDNVKAVGPIAPNSWAFNDNLKQYNGGIKTAEEMLGKSKSATESSKQKIVLTTLPQYDKVAQEISANWQELGFQTEVSIQTGIPPVFQAILFIEEIPTDPDQYVLWHSTQPGNITGYTSARNDKFLEDGRQTIDKEKRKQKYLDYQKYLVEDAPAAFLFYPTIYTITRK